ncbi:hypothetical protein J4207_03505 [Candidatus Woesearchaeota archaeon]|nr:hypothetical protein [Candidatus Woesearchaeota archaeon]
MERETMIAHEHLHLVNIRQLVALGLVALFAAVLMYVVDGILSPTSAFVVSIALLVGLAAFVMMLIQKSGVFLFFYGLVALFTITLSDVGIMGVKKILVYLIAALAFEVVFLLLKVRIHFVAADIVLGGALSGFVLPFFAALLLVGNFVIQLQVFNLMLLGFVSGLCGALVACAVWHYVKNVVLFIELDMYLRGI